MVDVVIDGPVGEDHIGLFGFEDSAERLGVGAVDDGVAVDLAGVEGRALRMSQAFWPSATRMTLSLRGFSGGRPR